MAHDPLAPFRREPKQGQREPDASTAEITWSEEGRRLVQPDEHRALRAAIDALNQIPNTPLSGEYKNTYALIPVLETVYKNAERELIQHQGDVPMINAGIDAAAVHDLKLLEEKGRAQAIDLEPER